MYRLGEVVYACSPSMQEVEAEGLSFDIRLGCTVSSRQAWAITARPHLIKKQKQEQTKAQQMPCLINDGQGRCSYTQLNSYFVHIEGSKLVGDLVTGKC